MSIQDLEDFNQDYELKSMIKPVNLGLYLKYRQDREARECLVRQNAEQVFAASYTTLPSKEELIFDVLVKCNVLPNKQLAVVKAFLRLGNLAKVASELGENKNTVKANFRHAAATLRKLMGDYYE